MKIFLSHSHRDKALVREIRGNLPSYIKTWIDDTDLLVAEDLRVSIKSAITEEAEYVVIFLGKEAIRSEWVQQELMWALDHENDLGRPFLLPVILDDVWDELPPRIRERKYLKCLDQSEVGVVAFSNLLKDQLFAWLCRRLEPSAIAELEEKQKTEAFTKALEQWVEVVPKLSKDHMSGIQRRLCEIMQSTKQYSARTRLDRIATVVKRELKRETQELSESKRRYDEMADNPIGQFSISMTFGSHQSAINLLQKLSEEVELYENHSDEVDPEDVLHRIEAFLR